MHVSLSPDDVIQAQRGDARALDRVVRASLPLVRSTFKRFPLSEHDQEEALQNAMLQVVRGLGRYRREARFTTWLYRLAVNEALMIMRKGRLQRARSADVPLDDLSEQELPRDEAALAAEQARLREALETLPEHYRATLVAHYNEDRDLSEIARHTNESESAVRARVHRARQMLRQRLGVEQRGHVAPRAA